MLHLSAAMHGAGIAGRKFAPETFVNQIGNAGAERNNGDIGEYFVGEGEHQQEAGLFVTYSPGTKVKHGVLVELSYGCFHVNISRRRHIFPAVAGYSSWHHW